MQVLKNTWAISNILIYKQRQQSYWGRQDAHLQLIRIKYIMTAKEALGAFKLPIDDGRTIGLVSNKIQANREGWLILQKKYSIMGPIRVHFWRNMRIVLKETAL